MQWVLLSSLVAYWCIRLTWSHADSSGEKKLQEHSVKVIDLTATANAWTLQSLTNKSLLVTGHPPSDVYLDLYHAGKIPDPYWRDNNIKLRWISKQGWAYFIDVSLHRNTHSFYRLRMDGVDTFADVIWNAALLGQTDNMFQAFTFHIESSNIHFGDYKKNRLNVIFKSPVAVANKSDADHYQKYKYHIPPTCVPELQHGECHPNYIRKMQASFSWDWGPAFPTMGLWREVYLEGYNTCVVDESSALTIFDSHASKWTIVVEVYVFCSVESSEIILTTKMIDFDLTATLSYKCKKGKQLLKQNMTIVDSNVERWWPAGYGSQKMYDLSTDVLFEPDTIPFMITKKVAFRTVELVQDPVKAANSNDGLTFFFRVNSIPVFLKGSNWIPGDAFYGRFSCSKIKYLLHSLVVANGNAMRVWGGGVYEKECLYDFADEMGILIWQDFMFAVALYPGTPEFLTSVGRETEYQVRRLKNHPSILVWAGNNENEQGIMGGWFAMDTDHKTYYKDYRALYLDTIGKIVAKEDITRPYLSSSPSNGIKTVEKNGLDSDPNSYYYGDRHHYDYNANAWNPAAFPTPRCVTEYGFQGLPSMESLLEALEESDLDYFGPQMTSRQHHTGGTAELTNQVFKQFRFPNCSSSGNSYFMPNQGGLEKDLTKVTCGANTLLTAKQFLEILIYLNQIYSGMSIRTETEHYRRQMTSLDPQTGLGKTMCALYWQLNDIWQAPTWASLEYNGRWKPLHYMSKTFFAPVLVSPYIDTRTNMFRVYIVSDLKESIREPMVLLIQTLPWQSFRASFETTVTLKEIEGLTSVQVFEAPVCKVFSCAGETLPGATSPPTWAAVHAKLSFTSNKTLVAPVGTWVTRKLKYVPTKDFGRVALTAASLLGPKKVILSLEATGVAPFVWLDVWGYPQGYFSDNAFTMTEQYRNVTFTSYNKIINARSFIQNLSVHSLGDIYLMANGGDESKMSLREIGKSRVSALNGLSA